MRSRYQPPEVWQTLIDRLQPDVRGQFDAVIWSLRMPRLLGGIAIGAGLGAAGASLQSFYRNPMADPYLLGISSAAGFGAVIGILVGSGVGAPIVVTAIAAITGAAYAVGIRRFARSSVDPSRLILIGLTLGIALLAWTVIAVFVADTPRLPTFTYFISELGTFSLVVADVSFISLCTLAEKFSEVGEAAADYLLLVKPQFEARRGDVGRGGIVTDAEVRWQTVEKVVACLDVAGIGAQNVIMSPIKGSDGNVEYLLWLRKGDKIVDLEVPN